MWRTVKISDVCEFQSGLWKGKRGPFTNANVIRNTNFRKNGNLSYENIALIEVETKELSKRQLQHGDIILEKSGGGEKTPVGRACLFEKQDSKIPFSLSNFTCFIRVKDPSILNYKYLHKFLFYIYTTGKTEPMQRNSTGIRNLQLKEYKDMSIPLPAIAEQKSIVAKIDALFVEIDRAINLIDDKNREFSKLLSSVLTELFNFSNTEKVKLGEICDVKRGTTITKRDTNNGTVPVIGGGTKPTYFHDKPNRKSGCITISGSGASAGYVNIWDTPIFASDCSTVEPRNDLHLKKFLYYYLVSQQQFIYENFRSGAAQPHVYAKDLSTLDYPIVSPTEQKGIVEKLDNNFLQIKLAKEILNNKKQNFLKLKSAILIDKFQTTTII